MGLSRFRLITFDLTGTLLKIRSGPGKQYGELGAMFGVYCDGNDLVKSFKTNREKLSTEHPNFGLRSKLGWEKWWQQLIISTFRDTGIQTPDEKLIELSNHVREVFKGSTCWQPCYGAFEILNFLKEQQRISGDLNNGNATFKMGIISNFDPRLDALLKNMKLSQYFDFALNSYDVGYEKPHAKIFEKAIDVSQFSRIEANQCLHIGDGLKTDYIGAKEVGWESALICEKSVKNIDPDMKFEVNEQHVFSSLFDFHKKIANDSICW